MRSCQILKDARLPRPGMPPVFLLPYGDASASVGGRGGYFTSAPQVRQWPLVSRNSQLHFQHCISAAKVATMPASALALACPWWPVVPAYWPLVRQPAVAGYGAGCCACLSP